MMLYKTTTNLIFASLLFFSSQVSHTYADKVKGVRRRLDDVPKQRNLKKGPKERDCGVGKNRIAGPLSIFIYKLNCRTVSGTNFPPSILTFRIEQRQGVFQVFVSTKRSTILVR